VQRIDGAVLHFARRSNEAEAGAAARRELADELAVVVP
jgi:hypothetical protein